MQFVAEAVAGALQRSNADSEDVSTYLTAPRPDSVRRPHLARLRAIVRSRMWKWLFDAHRVLGVTIEVLDDHDDVQTIYGNYELSDALMEKLGA